MSIELRLYATQIETGIAAMDDLRVAFPAPMMIGMDSGPVSEWLETLASLRRDLDEEIRALACDAVYKGVLSEVKAAELAGVSRPTLRKWLGK